MMKVTCRCGTATEYAEDPEPWDTYSLCGGCNSDHRVDLFCWQDRPCNAIIREDGS